MDANIDQTAREYHPLTLVIRANDFTSRIDDGYLMRDHARVGGLLTPAEIGAYIAANPKARISFLRT